MAKYILIYDTGDMVFDTQAEALKFAKYLKAKGHKLDRLQQYRYSGKSYDTSPKVFKTWNTKKRASSHTASDILNKMMGGN
jgi:hypothetical protein